MVRQLCTIGYEAATLEEVISRLTGAGVELLIDVRAVASSRRAGFSKTLLAAGLAEADIDYLHLRALGTPNAGREAARKGRIAEMRAIYEAHLTTPEAQDAYADALGVVQARPAALLCYEAEAAGCHRRVLTERIAAKTGLAIRDL